MAASDAAMLIVSGKLGATAVGICIGGGWNLQAQYLVVRGEGVTGPTARGLYLRDATAMLRHLVGAPIADSTAAATFELVMKEMDGSTSITMQITTCRAGSANFNMDRDAPPGSFDQEFLHVGDMATTPLSVA